MNERDLERASRLAEAERQAGIDAASAAVSGLGRTVCGCGAAISDYRRLNLAATRCIECQKDFEAENVRK